MKIVFTVKLLMKCLICGSIMCYHACYEVNYKSNEISIKIVILRYRCMKCNMTHAIKPDFLASRHQYDTYERQHFVSEYISASRGKTSIRKLAEKLFPYIQVSHTVMYYWLKVISRKKIAIELLFVKDIQVFYPALDIEGSLLPEASIIPPGIRQKKYAMDLMEIFNWGCVYIRLISGFRSNPLNEGYCKSYIHVNIILDLLQAHEFL